MRSPGSDSESSDVEARSTGEVTPPSTPGTLRTEKKSIGRSASVSSSGPFVATPEWVLLILFFFLITRSCFFPSTLLIVGRENKGYCYPEWILNIR